MISHFDLTGKKIIILGGAGLIGSEFSRTAAASGATVIIAEKEAKKANRLAQSINADGGIAFPEQCDTTDEKSVRKFVARVIRRHKCIDGLVNTAHFNTGKPGAAPTETTFRELRQYLNNHLGGPFLATREIGKQMIKQRSGSIVFMGSIYGVKAPRFEIYKGTSMTVRAEYEIAKAGLIQFTKHLAKQWGPYGIRVNTISPGGVFNNQDPKFVKEYTKHVVLGNRMANPDDIAPTLVYLLSEASRYVTGQNIIIDGGWTL